MMVSPVKPSVPELFCCSEVFDYWFCLLTAKWLFRFSIHDSVLIDCMFLGIYSCLPCPNCWPLIVHKVSYDPLYFCGNNCNVYLLFLFSKKQALSLIYLFYCLFCFPFIYFCSDFIIFFLPSTNLGRHLFFF